MVFNNKFVPLAFAVSITLLYPVICTAGSMVGDCADCHTMHNSQDGQAVARSGIGAVLSGAQEMLLKLDCIACHSGLNSGATASAPYDPPFVDNLGAVSYMTTGTEVGANTLAAGTFYFVRTFSEAMGHNVNGITGPDTRFATVPGDTDTAYVQLECAGTNGCHGNRAKGNELPIAAMKGAHHFNENSIWKDGTTLPRSYRFLNGTQGYGSKTYEYASSLSRTEHNRYFGKVRTEHTDSAAPDYASNSDNGTISGFCALCHKDYHNGNSSVGLFGPSVWIRHTSDFDMSDSVSSNEYLDYNYNATGTKGGARYYNVIAPLATAQKGTTAQEFVLTGTGDDAVVMCLSCHRAHGSEFHAAMRWDYRNWPSSAGKSYDGCSICHPTKD